METNTNSNSEIKTSCPSCKLVMLAQNEWIGMGTECPKCKTKFIIQKTADKMPHFWQHKSVMKKVLLGLSIGVFTAAGIIAVNTFFFSSDQSVNNKKGLSESEKRQWKSHFMRKYDLLEAEADQLVNQGFLTDATSVMLRLQASGYIDDFQHDLEKLHRQMGR